MAFVKFTSALNSFFPDLATMEVKGDSLQAILSGVGKNVPGISNYLLEEDGSLRKHINIFIQNELIKDRMTLSDQVHDQDEILIYQALSGG